MYTWHTHTHTHLSLLIQIVVPKELYYRERVRLRYSLYVFFYLISSRCKRDYFARERERESVVSSADGCGFGERQIASAREIAEEAGAHPSAMSRRRGRRLRLKDRSRRSEAHSPWLSTHLRACVNEFALPRPVARRQLARVRNATRDSRLFTCRERPTGVSLRRRRDPEAPQP